MVPDAWDWYYGVLMANTSALQEAFDWVRDELERLHGRAFLKTQVRLRTGGKRSFNAVSVDGTIVATVMNSSGLTSGGKKPVGKIRGAVAELYFLSLVDAPKRVLIITDPDFCAIVTNELAGAVANGLEIQNIALPDSLKVRVSAVTGAASAEMGR